jgi:hypothetical protein
MNHNSDIHIISRYRKKRKNKSTYISLYTQYLFAWVRYNMIHVSSIILTISFVSIINSSYNPIPIDSVIISTMGSTPTETVYVSNEFVPIQNRRKNVVSEFVCSRPSLNWSFFLMLCSFVLFIISLSMNC